MSPDKQIIAIAEARGWKWVSNSFDHRYMIPPNSKDRSTPATSAMPLCDDALDGVPDYLHDLNAMHEAKIALLNTTQKRRTFWNYCVEAMQRRLGRYLDQWECIVIVTSADESEAFLKTIGKWEE